MNFFYNEEEEEELANQSTSKQDDEPSTVTAALSDKDNNNKDQTEAHQMLKSIAANEAWDANALPWTELQSALRLQIQSVRPMSPTSALRLSSCVLAELPSPTASRPLCSE